jgi:ABC transport system ATP-binding/permease protein
LQEILADYSGTLLIVSHDRDFLDRTVTEVLAFEGDGVVESHLGGYSDYYAAKQQVIASQKKIIMAKKATVEKPVATVKRAPTLSGKQRFELEKLPEKIAALEVEITVLRTSLLDPDLYIRDPAAFDCTTARFMTAQSELDAAELRWLELEERRQF